jgi:hypothetical protein
VAIASNFAFVEALVLCQLQVNVGDFISISLGMDAGIFWMCMKGVCLFAMCIEEYIRNMVDLEVRPELTFRVSGSFYQVQLSFMKS